MESGSWMLPIVIVTSGSRFVLMTSQKVLGGDVMLTLKVAPSGRPSGGRESK